VVRDVDLQVAEPGRLLLLLESRGVEVEVAQDVDPEQDLREAHEQGERARPEARPRQDPDDERTGQREEDQRGRHRTLAALAST
jgi:hypothetical protein